MKRIFLMVALFAVGACGLLRAEVAPETVFTYGTNSVPIRSGDSFIFDGRSAQWRSIAGLGAGGGIYHYFNMRNAIGSEILYLNIIGGSNIGTGPLFAPPGADNFNAFIIYLLHTNDIAPGGGAVQTTIIQPFPLRSGPWRRLMFYNTNDETPDTSVPNDPRIENPFSWIMEGIATRPLGPTIMIYDGDIVNARLILDDSLRTQFQLVGGDISVVNLGSVPVQPGSRSFFVTCENIGTGPLTVSNFRSVTGTANCTITPITKFPLVINQDQNAIIEYSISGDTVGTGCVGRISVSSNSSQNRGSYDWEVRGTVVTSPELEIKESGAYEIIEEDVRPGGTFPNNAPWRAVTQSYTVKNIGTANLTITNLPTAIPNPGGSVVTTVAWNPPYTGGYPLVMVPDTTRQLDVTYYPTLPTAPGTYLFRMNFPNNDLDEGGIFWDVTGTAVVPQPNINIRSVTNARNIPDGGIDAHAGFNSGMRTINFTLDNANGDEVLSVSNFSVVDSANCAFTTNFPATPFIRTRLDPSVPFSIDVTPADPTLVWRVNVQVDSNSPGESPYNFLVTNYTTGANKKKDKTCGFGTPFGMLLLLGFGFFTYRRRSQR